MNTGEPELIPVDPCEGFFIVSQDWLTAGRPYPSGYGSRNVAIPLDVALCT